MNDKDRELLAQVLRSAGSAGEQGFTYLVHYRFVDGLTSVIGFALAIAGGIWCLRKLVEWKPDRDFLSMEPGFRGAGMVLLCIAIFGCLVGVMSGINSMVAPEGAAIQSALSTIK